MVTELPAVPQMPTAAASMLPLPLPASPVAGNQFLDTLVKQLGVAAPADAPEIALPDTGIPMPTPQQSPEQPQTPVLLPQLPAGPPASVPQPARAQRAAPLSRHDTPQQAMPAAVVASEPPPTPLVTIAVAVAAATPPPDAAAVVPSEPAEIPRAALVDRWQPAPQVLVSHAKPAPEHKVPSDTASPAPAAIDPAPALPTVASARPEQPPVLAVPAHTAEYTAPAAVTASPPLPDTDPPRVASPAAQLAPALVQVSHAPDGAQRLTLRLDPPELGHVQIRIERPAEAPARVEITVEKPETLQLLLRDQPQLQRALDQAGVPAEGRSVTLHIASAEPLQARSEGATAPTPSVTSGGLSGDGWQGASRQGGQPQRQSGGTFNGDDAEPGIAVAAGWIRAGLDITA